MNPYRFSIKMKYEITCIYLRPLLRSAASFITFRDWDGIVTWGSDKAMGNGILINCGCRNPAAAAWAEDDAVDPIQTKSNELRCFNNYNFRDADKSKLVPFASLWGWSCMPGGKLSITPFGKEELGVA